MRLKLVSVWFSSKPDLGMLLSRLSSLEDIGLDHPLFSFINCVYTFLDMMTPKRKTLTLPCIVSCSFFVHISVSVWHDLNKNTRKPAKNCRLSGWWRKLCNDLSPVPKPFNHPHPDPFFHSFDRRPSKSLTVSFSLLFLLSFLLYSSSCSFSFLLFYLFPRKGFLIEQTCDKWVQRKGRGLSETVKCCTVFFPRNEAKQENHTSILFNSFETH